jgi:hypothetical protein
MLTIQQPVMRTVIQDSFEWIRKALIFTNAFPDTFVAMEFTRDSLLAAAESHDRAINIHDRLVCDAEYMNSLARLVSFLILIMMLLTFISASRTHSAFPSRSEGALRRNRAS